MEDFIYNGQACGDVASRLIASDFNTNAMRPYSINGKGTYFTTINSQGKAEATLASNATSTLRKDDWELLDSVVVKVARERLRAVADLMGMGLQYTIPNGMGKTVLQTETQSDISDAEVTMDGLEMAGNDRPKYELTNMPLPIIHKDFSISLRQLNTSRQGGSPFDTTMAEAASRKVSEIAEKLLVGTLSSFTFGGGTLYGYTNFPSRLTATITSPVASGWTAATTVSEVLGMIQSAVNAYHYGPYVIYYGPSWNRYMNDEYKAESNDTLSQRLARMDNVLSVKQLDHLTGYDIVVVQMTSDVVREVIGMPITTLQWDTNGGLQKNFKVMAIMCPQLRADQNGRTGVVHGSVA